MPTVLINKVRGNEVTETMNFVMEECCNCGIPFFMPKYFKDARYKSHDLFYCPQGHPQHYTSETNSEKEIRELKERLDREAFNKRMVENQLLDTINEKNILSRKLKRVHKGVCPCCNRTFENLQKHMETKHPEKVISK